MRYNRRSIYNGQTQFNSVTDQIYFENFYGVVVPPPFARVITTEDDISITTEDDNELTTEG